MASALLYPWEPPPQWCLIFEKEGVSDARVWERGCAITLETLIVFPWLPLSRHGVPWTVVLTKMYTLPRPMFF